MIIKIAVSAWYFSYAACCCVLDNFCKLLGSRSTIEQSGTVLTYNTAHLIHTPLCFACCVCDVLLVV